jgi:protein-tyrosine-phosphatase
MPTILFICTGNLCRSPMAEALLRARLDQDPDRREWQVGSAGTWAADGRAASAYAIEEMALRDIDISPHRARSVNRELMVEADLVLAMAQDHVHMLTATFPDQVHKIYLLSEMIDGKYDISDPYGGSPMEYAYIAEELEQLIEEGYERIVALVEESEG